MKHWGILFVSICLCHQARADSISLSIDEGSSIRHWPVMGVPMEGCGEFGQGPCTFSIAGEFVFNTEANGVPAMSEVSVTIFGNDEVPGQTELAGLAADWMSSLRFWRESSELWSSVGTIEIRLTQGGFSLYGLQDGRPGDGSAIQFNVRASDNLFRPGDASSDGVVDATDLNVLGNNWLREDAFSWAEGDFNGDQRVDEQDLNALGMNWQTDIRPAAAAIPEPSAMVLILTILVGLLIRR